MKIINFRRSVAAVLSAALLFFVAMSVTPAAHAQQTFHTVDSDGTGKSVQINKNRAKLSKLRNDVVVTQNKLRQAGPQAKDLADTCNTSHKLRWNGSTWSCLEESDHHSNPFAEQDLPNCPSGWVLTSTSTTALGCNMPEKGPIGPAPTWRMPNGGDNLQVQNPNGSWGSSVYIRGDPGDTYTWYTGAYGGCSSTCGPGTRTRVVECRKNMFTTVADSQCASPRPTDTTSCNPGYTFSWSSYGSWGSCSNSCGTGTQDRTRSCLRCDGSTVSSSNCSGSATDTRSCSSTSGCSYTWVYGSYGTCSNTCGSGTQTRSATCRRSDGATVSGSNCPGSPTTSRSCSSTSGCTYSWNYGSWGTCSSSCSQSRSATCRRSDGTSVSNSNCSGSPYTSRSCTGGNCNPCGAPYSWTSYGSWSGWSSCNSSCQQSRTRTRSCRDSCGSTVSASNCSGSATDTDSQACWGGHSWSSWSGYSSCSRSCGGGTKSRTRNCIRGCNGAVVSDGYCSGSSIDYADCNTHSCCGSPYSWGSYGSWSSCSKSCGGGTQTRTRSCRDSCGSTVSASYCSGSATDSRSCNTQSCFGGGGDDCCAHLGRNWYKCGQFSCCDRNGREASQVTMC